MLRAGDSSASEEEGSALHLKMISHGNTIARSLYYAQLKVHLQRYRDLEGLELIDKKILLGLFSKDV